MRRISSLLTPVLLGTALAACGGDSPPADEAPAVAASGDEVAEPGKWYTARRTGDGLTDEQRARMAELEAMGYASGTEEAGGMVGITRHDPEASQPGHNFFVSGHAPVALLMDARGHVLHEWRCTLEQAWPEGAPRPAEFWRRARLLPDGRVLAMFENVGLVLLDRDSRILWRHAGLVHHDVDLDPEGNIWLLEREAQVVFWLHPDRPLLDDLVVVLSPEGEELRRLSLLEAMRDSRHAEKLLGQLRRQIEAGLKKEQAYREENAAEIAADPERYARLDFIGDIFHTNTLQWLDGSQAHVRPGFAKGNLLLCVRNMDRVVVLDPRSKRVLWSLAGAFKGPHEPTLLDSGTILLFDNHGPRKEGLRGYSQVLELDPASRTAIWTYRAEESGQFFSPIAGTCQRLANGNTLIVESTQGRAFEVTPNKELVWEFHSPYRTGAQGELVAFLPDLVRVPEAEVATWLEEQGD